MTDTAPTSAADQSAAALEEAASQQFEAGACAKALALQRQALGLHVAHHRLADQARCHLSIGYLCFLLRDHAGGQQAYRAAIRLWEGLQDCHGAAVGWERLAELHQYIGDHQAALHAFDQALAFLRRCGALKDLGTLLNNKAVSYREIGQRAQAIQCQERALEIRQEVGDNDGLAASLHNLGVLHADAGAHEAAAAALEQARELRESLGDRSALASTELHIGILHEQQGDFEQAAKAYEGVISACATLSPHDSRTVAAALCNLGGLMVARGEPAGAMPLLERARGLLQESVETPGLAYVEYHLGLARIAQGDVDGGLAALTKAQGIQQACGDIRQLSATLSAKAWVDVRLRRFASAEPLLREALDIQQRLDEHAARVQTLSLLGNCLAGLGRFEAAQQCHRQAEHLSMLLALPLPRAEAPVGSPDPAPATALAAVNGVHRVLQ